MRGGSNRRCAILPSGSGYKVVTPYMQSFVDELKMSVPASQRSYSKNDHCWIVSAQYGNAIGALIAKCFGQYVDVPPISAAASVSRILEILYIGQCKQRGGGECSAFGWSQLPGELIPGWNVIFPEKVLRAWFEPDFGEPERPSERTYYQTLGIQMAANPDEIKSAYRRMVRQWHPDVCKEPDAAEVFMKIQKAFEILSNPKTRGRYDAGLKLEQAAGKTDKPTQQSVSEYRAPLRCGLILADCTELGNRLTVQKIKAWQDIVSPAGKVLVTSWPMGANEPSLTWN